MISQKELKREIFSKKEKLTDHELFVSESYNTFLTQMQAGVTECETGCTAKIVEDDSHIAYTDGKAVCISYDNDISKGHSRKERHLIYCGLNLHECGHILFTDFALMEKCLKELVDGNIYPVPNDNPYLQGLRDFLYTDGNASYILPLFKNLDNCIEDGFVDRAIMSLVPGYARSLRYVRTVDNSLENISYKEMVAKKYPKVNIFINMVLFYARHGVLLYEDDDKGELIDSFKEVIPVIKKAVFTTSPFQRKKMVWEVFCYLFNFIEIDNKKNNSQNGQTGQSGNQQKNSQNGGQQGNNSQSNGQQGNPQNGSQNGNQQGNTSQNSQNGQQNSPNNNQQGNNSNDDSQQGNSQNGNQQGNNSQNGSQQGNASQDGSQSGNDGLQDALKSAASAMKNTEKTEHKNTVSPNSQALSNLTNAMGNGDPASTSSDNSQKNGEIGNMESPELDALANKVAENSVCNKQEKEIQKEMQQNVKDYLSDSDFHKGIRSRCHRAEVTPYAKKMYEEEHGELDKIVHRMISEFEKEIKERQTGDTMTGLYTGKRFEAREAYRYDKRVMSRKILPEDIPDMAVGILVDCSGSMGGEKIEYAIKTAYITYTFCRRLNIPVFVTGHTTCGDEVSLISVADENSLDGNDKIRIFSLSAMSCNRDGYALKYSMEKLKKIPADQKLMMVISDGKPNHTSYHLAEGREDCQSIVKDGIKNGITTITAAIDDAVSVKSVYKEGISEKNSAAYLDLSDLQKLPKAFVKIIKKRLE